MAWYGERTDIITMNSAGTMILCVHRTSLITYITFHFLCITGVHTEFTNERTTKETTNHETKRFQQCLAKRMFSASTRTWTPQRLRNPSTMVMLRTLRMLPKWKKSKWASSRGVTKRGSRWSTTLSVLLSFPLTTTVLITLWSRPTCHRNYETPQLT